MDKLLLLIALLIALTSFMLSLPLLRLLLKPRLETGRRLSQLNRPAEESASPVKVKRSPRLPGIPRQRLVKLENELYMANLMLRADEFIAAWVAVTVLIPGLALFLGAEPVTVAAMIIICAAAPIVAVKLIKKQRLNKLDSQLVDALAVMCGALRAGFSFQKALETIAGEMPDPISREFGRLSREINLGMPMELSFSRLVERTRNRDLEMALYSVLVQRQVGGNLVEVLDNVADTVRQRMKIKGDIKVLTASGTISGYVIGLLPVILMLILMVINPGYMEMFFVTSLGRLMLLAAVVLELIGFLVVKRIVTIKM